MPKIQYKTMKC